MSKFQKRHYDAVAAVLRETRPPAMAETDAESEAAEYCRWYAIYVALSRMFRDDNERFEPKRFAKACGL